MLDHLLIVHVRDTGQGIAEEDIPNLFSQSKKFPHIEQAHERLSLGIGLKLVKHIVTMSPGLIQVESGGRNRGSLFKFTMEMMPTFGLQQHIEEEISQEVEQEECD